MKCPHNHEVKQRVKLGLVVFQHVKDGRECKLLNTGKGLSLDKLNAEYLKAYKPNAGSAYVNATIASASVIEYVVDWIENEASLDEISTVLWAYHKKRRLPDKLVEAFDKRFGKYAAVLLKKIQLFEQYSPNTKHNNGNYYGSFTNSGMYHKRPKCLEEVQLADEELSSETTVQSQFDELDFQRVEVVIETNADLMADALNRIVDSIRKARCEASQFQIPESHDPGKDFKDFKELVESKAELLVEGKAEVLDEFEVTDWTKKDAYEQMTQMLAQTAQRAVVDASLIFTDEFTDEEEEVNG